VLSTRERAPLPRCACLDRSNDDERRQSYRARRLHATRPRTFASDRRGRIVAPEYQDGEDPTRHRPFEISDERSPAESLQSFGTEDSNRLERLGSGSLPRMERSAVTVKSGGTPARRKRSRAYRVLSIAAASIWWSTTASPCIDTNGQSAHLPEGDRIEIHPRRCRADNQD